MTLTRTAPAKINLTLEVLGRRHDGYHEIRSVMQAVSVHDTLRFRNASPGEFRLEGGNRAAPPDESNLVLRAARMLNDMLENRHGAHITLDKCIPVGAGLGGGSSDAATTLRALNELWKARLPVEDLMAIGASLGSDVPFFLTSGTALATGRGEKLSSLPPAPMLWLALVKPAASLPTPDVYREFSRTLDASRPGDDASKRMIAALAPGEHGHHVIRNVAGALCNDLEDAAVRLCPEVGDILASLSDAGAEGTLLSGSGSAVFALAGSEGHARQLGAVMGSSAAWSAIAHTVSLPFEEH